MHSTLSRAGRSADERAGGGGRSDGGTADPPRLQVVTDVPPLLRRPDVRRLSPRCSLQGSPNERVTEELGANSPLLRPCRRDPRTCSKSPFRTSVNKVARCSVCQASAPQAFCLTAACSTALSCDSPRMLSGEG